jgi:hypothetical protein
MTPRDLIPSACRIAPEMLAAIEDGACRLPDSERDAFFNSVCDILRPIRELAQTDVHCAVCIALHKHKETKEADHYA